MKIPVQAEHIFTIASLPITNSLLAGWIVAFLFICLAGLFAKKPTLIPRGIQNVIEALLEFMLDFMDQVTHDRVRSKKFLPVVGTFFLLILVSNWMGLIPGFGTIGVWKNVHGEIELVPLFRAATSDLNMTIALGVSAVVISHIFGIAAIGFFKYGNKFLQIVPVWNSFKKFGKISFSDAVIGVFAALVEFAVGLLELISEVAKMVSLSLRLFGNVFAGEVLLTVLSSLIAFVLPLPFMFMELIVGAVQALVFSMLTLVYLTIATEVPHGEEHAGEEKHPQPAH